MKIISFAWTTDALISGQKTVTRRDWNHDYARSFTDPLVQAYDKSPRSGGKCVAILRLKSIRHEFDAEAPDDDYEAEGFEFIYSRLQRKAWADGLDEPHGEIADRVSEEGFDLWRAAAGATKSYVIRYRLAELTEVGRKIRDRLERDYPDLLAPVPTGTMAVNT
jgi:hypothetical protein